MSLKFTHAFSFVVFLYFYWNETNCCWAVLLLWVCHQCPEKEPSCCRYLRVCEPCNERMQSRQIAEYETASRQSAVDEVNQMWLLLDQVNEKLRKLQTKIDENLPKVGICDVVYTVHSYKKLIRRWDSERELSVRWHHTRTTKYNRLVHSATDRCGGYVWNACLPNSVK